jgi:GntR family transcriptional regulator
MSPANRSHAVPHAYEQVLTDLTASIDSGELRPGDLVPTVRDLADRYGVSPSTARQAVEALQRTGLAYSGYFDGKRGVRVRSQGRTDFHATDALRPGRPGGGKDAFTENALKAGRSPSKRFTMVMRVPPRGIARRLGLAPDAIAVERTTIQLLDGEPWSRERSWYPRDFAADTGLDSPHDIDEGTIRHLRARGFEETAARDEAMDATANQQDVADLGVILGSPLLVQTRTAATNDRVTRVTQTVRLGGRNRLIWETGSDTGLDVIRRQLIAGSKLAGDVDTDVPEDEYEDQDVRTD